MYRITFITILIRYLYLSIPSLVLTANWKQQNSRHCRTFVFFFKKQNYYIRKRFPKSFSICTSQSANRLTIRKYTVIKPTPCLISTECAAISQNPFQLMPNWCAQLRADIWIFEFVDVSFGRTDGNELIMLFDNSCALHISLQLGCSGCRCFHFNVENCICIYPLNFACFFFK